MGKSKRFRKSILPHTVTSRSHLFQASYRRPKYTFGFLVFYSHRVAVLIQNPDAIGRIVDDIRRAAEVSSRENRGQPRSEARGNGGQIYSADGEPVLSPTSGYLQEIDHLGLVRAASDAGALISIPVRPGQFVLVGEVIGVISPSEAALTLTPSLVKGIELGRHRVLAQDFEFGLAQIVEIAIRALSPAVNDTFTGIASVDLLGEALATLAGARKIGGNRYDSSGELRLQVRPLLLPRLIKQAFDQIRQAAAENPAVLIRLLSTLERLSSKMQDAQDRDALLQQAKAVWETASSRPLVTMDRQDVESAWIKASGALQPGRT